MAESYPVEVVHKGESSLWDFSVEALLEVEGDILDGAEVDDPKDRTKQ